MRHGWGLTHEFAAREILTRGWCSLGRRDSVWYQVCLGHMFVLELFMIRLLLIYQTHCSLSDNIHLLVFALISSLVNVVA